MYIIFTAYSFMHTCLSSWRRHFASSLGNNSNFKKYSFFSESKKDLTYQGFFFLSQEIHFYQNYLLSPILLYLTLNLFNYSKCFSCKSLKYKRKSIWTLSFCHLLPVTLFNGQNSLCYTFKLQSIEIACLSVII